MINGMGEEITYVHECRFNITSTFKDGEYIESL